MPGRASSGGRGGDSTASAAAETAIRRLVIVAVPIWLLSTASVAFAAGSGWSPALVVACLACALVSFAMFIVRRSSGVLLVPLAAIGAVLALASPPSADMSGGSVVSTWASLASLCFGALVRGAWGPLAAVLGGVGPLALARLRQGLDGTVGDPGRWLEVATFAVFAGLVAASVVGVLRRTAQQADDVAVLRARAAASAAQVHAAQAELRRVGRMLHDTVVNTLCAIHRWTSASREAAMARCTADLAFLRAVQGADTPEPSALIDSVRARAALLGLDLAVTVTSAGPALDPRTYLAVEGACWEALNNVARHAGVDGAGLTWSWDGQRGSVSIVDGGVGFDAGLGWTGGSAESLGERCAEAGVVAAVASRPGAGTTVTLAWQAGDVPDDDTLPGPAIRGELDQAMAATVLRMSAVVGGIGLISTIMLPADLPRWGSILALGIIAAVAALALSVSRGRALPRIPVPVYPVAMVAATVLPALGRATSPSGGLWWWGPPACLGVGVGAFLLDRRRSVVPWVVVGCAVGIVVGAAQIGPGPGSARPDQISILILDLGAIAALVAYRRKLTDAWIVGRREQDRMALEVASKVRAAEESRIRSHLLAVAREIAEPLLSGIAGGSLDPLDPKVRARCGQAEATLRALSAVPVSSTGGMGTLLAEKVVQAPARGVDLALRLGPEAELPPDGSVDEVGRVLDTVVGGCPGSGSAQVTLLRTGGTSRMLVLADLADQAGPEVVQGLMEATADGVLGQWSVQQVGDQVLCEAVWPAV